MKTAQAKIVGGAVVTRAKFREGARLTLVVHDERKPVTLNLDDEAAILAGIAEVDAGHGVPIARARAKLRGRR